MDVLKIEVVEGESASASFQQLQKQIPALHFLDYDTPASSDWGLGGCVCVWGGSAYITSDLANALIEGPFARLHLL